MLAGIMSNTHGGSRRDSGRKTGKSVIRRVPLPLAPMFDTVIEQFRQAHKQKLPAGALLPAPLPARQGLPLFTETVRAGFPSPAEGYVERLLDLNEFLIDNPPATFFLKAAGDSMRDAGIETGDLLVVDRSKEPRHGDIVVAAVGGDFTAKTLYRKEGVCELRPANPDYSPIPFPQTENDRIIGVVTWALKDVRAR